MPHPTSQGVGAHLIKVTEQRRLGDIERRFNVALPARIVFVGWRHWLQRP